MKNPFVYGKEVSKENFCNRITEIKELLRDIHNSQNVLIYSQRRFGKTSLIKRVFEEINNKNIIIVYVDLYPMLSEDDFVKMYAKEISKVVTSGISGHLKKLSSVFKRIRPVFSIDQTGQSGFSIDVKHNELNLFIEDVLEGLNRYVEKKSKKAVVCFDEFQQISYFKTDRLEKDMRSIIQTHKNISYIFMGSKKHLINDIFNNPNRPFYRSVKSFPLNKINIQELKKFIIEKFYLSQKNISEKLVDKIILECETHPYYVQYLCHILWEQTIDKKRITEKDFNKCFNTLLLRESSTFEATWDSLSLNQKQVLAALTANDENEKIFSSEFLQKHNLGSASSLHRTINSLLNKDLIDRTNDIYTIIDVIFKKWIFSRYLI